MPDRQAALEARRMGRDKIHESAHGLRFGLGLDVPGDVSVIGYDDVPMASWPSYALTTIRQPVNRMVAATVKAILGQIAGTMPAQKTRIDGPLMVRRSARLPQGQVP